MARGVLCEHRRIGLDLDGGRILGEVVGGDASELKNGTLVSVGRHGNAESLVVLDLNGVCAGRTDLHGPDVLAQREVEAKTSPLK